MFSLFTPLTVRIPKIKYTLQKKKEFKVIRLFFFRNDPSVSPVDDPLENIQPECLWKNLT